MTELRVETLRLPAADLGPENPLPQFRSPRQDREVKVDGELPEAERRWLGWRTGFRVLPYRLQDGYGTELRDRDFKSLVLENETLRAEVLPELGGRLISLFHKPAGRELLERNRIVRFGNLALRQAWFSGGVEWNTPQPGHHYLTCSPVFAARTAGSRGEPGLRLYEWDRVKCFPWQIDFHLPPGSPFLFARVRLVNPHEREMPMYWWTNIAVPESPDTRVLAPAEKAIRFMLGRGFTLVDFATGDELDHSYALNVAGSRDLFFRLPDGHWPWIAALDGGGRGVFQTSTPRLRGRKMFLWGNHQGGRRWQEFLGGAGHNYVEIQAGLTRTQAETMPMPALAEWTWTEAFGLLEADPQAVHGDWEGAWRAAESALRETLSPDEIASVDGRLAETTTRPPEEILFSGSGWGALERRRLAAANAPDRIPAELVFGDETLGPDQEPWLALLESGALPQRKIADEPGHWMIQPEWAALLESALGSGGGDHWLSWLHLGVARAEAFDFDGARAAWQKSLERERSAWALRSLAALAAREERLIEARALFEEAWGLGPRSAALAVEYAHLLERAGDHQGIRDFVAGLDAELRANERLVMIDAGAAIETGDFGAAGRALEGEFVTVREGATTLTDLWFRLQQRRLAAAEGTEIDDALRERVRREFPAPWRIDFRQKA